jgi:pyrroline-5-carboxylate reductase
MPPARLALIGCGTMGSAVVAAAAKVESVVATLHAFDPDPEKAAAVERATVEYTASDAVTKADVVLLAVKPQHAADAVASFCEAAAGRLVVSVMAGVTTAWLEARLPRARVVRTMPNTPILAGRGVVAICGGATATKDDLDRAAALFVGSLIERLDESQMDAATAVSGSGPAYVFAFVEALAAAGRAAGLPDAAADRMARETIVGAAALLDASDDEPADLRRRVTSPGGTTAAALDVFTTRDLNEIVRDAVAAAAERGRRLSEDA